jgi:hypothetical protein
MPLDIEHGLEDPLIKGPPPFDLLTHHFFP